MKKMLKYLAGMCCAVLALAGCVNVEYIGQDFPALPEEKNVMIFQEKDQLPPGEFQAIGKLKMVVPPGVDMVEVRELIAENARKHGASAARIVSVEKKLANRYYGARQEESLSPMLASRSTVGGMAAQPDGSPTEVNSFGDVVQPNRTYRERYEHLVKVQLLMPVQEYNRAVDLRRAAAREEK
jgi:hypothetical protein